MRPPSGYDLWIYGRMANHAARMDAYSSALQRAVKPGCRVLDLGSGIGIFALLACRYGAGSVIAVEPDPAISVARAAAAANGFADRISFFEGLSYDLGSDTKADIIVSDLRGAFPLFESHIPAIVDARRRLLADGGVLIPQRDTLRVAIAEDREAYRPCAEPWLSNSYGLDLSAGHPYAVNHVRRLELLPSQLVSAAETFAVLDYRTVTDPNVTGVVTMTTTRDATAHGLVFWFEAELLDGIGFSNAPGAPQPIYPQHFLPFERATTLGVGDRVQATIGAHLIDGDYVWTWRTEVFKGTEQSPSIIFDQSTLFANVVSAERLRRRAATYTPPRREDCALDRHCLGLFDGKTSLETIAHHLIRHDPSRFASVSAALTYAADLAARYHGRP